MEIYLTSAGFVKKITNLSNNEHDKYINTAIREAQDMYLQTTIGSSLFNKLKKLIETNEIGKEENIAYKQLLDLSQWYLAYIVLSQLCVITNIKLDNAGLLQTSDTNMQPISVNDTFKVRQFYEDKADFYKKRVQEYCLEHRKDLKELTTNKCTEIKTNLYSANSCTVWLGGTRGKEMFRGYLRCNGLR